MGRLSKASKTRTIAVLEESTDNIYSFRFILQSLGYNAVGIEVNARLGEALERVAPSAVVVDLMLPGGNPLDLLQAVRRLSGKNVKVLALTADAVPFDEAAILAAGADEVVVKPYSVSEVQAKLG